MITSGAVPAPLLHHHRRVTRRHAATHDFAGALTAAEVASDAGSERPDLRELLWSGALTFGEIWYGRRPATDRDHELLLRLDTAVRRRPAAGRPFSSAGFTPAAPPPR